MTLYPEPIPYGTWQSPITSEVLVEDAVRLGQVKTEGDRAYWMEGRPTEQGRGVLVQWQRGQPRYDLTPPKFSVRTKAQEYGGGDFLVIDDGVVFANGSDQRLYRQSDGNTPAPITPEGPWRYADGAFDRTRSRILCSVENHLPDVPEPENFIGAIPFPQGGAPTPILQGHDFYSNPVLSPSGDQLAWICWDHPNMPWDAAELWLGDLADNGSVSNARNVGGGENESVFQPQWGPDGHLYFVSDRSGWWNLYRLRDGCVEDVYRQAAEMGLPQWVFGMSTYGFPGPDQIAVGLHQQGRWSLHLVDLTTGAGRCLSLPYSEITSVHCVPNGIILQAASPSQANSIVYVDVQSGKASTLRRSVQVNVDVDLLSHPQHIEFPTRDQAVAHAFYYRPTNPDAVGPEGETPPLIVKCHGGPTSCASTALDLRIQYWTSRGFAVVDVNYRGSTGFGRGYREPLQGEWGVVDVTDCIDAAAFLVANGQADKDRLIISGSSAGGYTTLCALTFHDVFKAGASYYGISDLESLLADTHKFEARYFDGLVGRYPEEKDRYQERSPIHSPEALSCPVIFLQGADDHVVPPNQARTMVDALKTQGLPVAYVEFAEEGHGFRRAGTIQRAIESELYFYGEVFKLDLPDVLDPVTIHNL